jgi:hypothetical protein
MIEIYGSNIRHILRPKDLDAIRLRCFMNGFCFGIATAAISIVFISI